MLIAVRSFCLKMLLHASSLWSMQFFFETLMRGDFFLVMPVITDEESPAVRLALFYLYAGLFVLFFVPILALCKFGT